MEDPAERHVTTDTMRKLMSFWKTHRVQDVVPQSFTILETQNPRALNVNVVAIAHETNGSKRDVDLHPLDHHGPERIIHTWCNDRREDGRRVKVVQVRRLDAHGLHDRVDNAKYVFIQ